MPFEPELEDLSEKKSQIRDVRMILWHNITSAEQGDAFHLLRVPWQPGNLLRLPPTYLQCHASDTPELLKVQVKVEFAIYEVFILQQMMMDVQ